MSDVLCACGCGCSMSSIDRRGRKRTFIYGHQRAGQGVPFWSQCVAALNNCIVWVGYRVNGYGRVMVRGKVWWTHRYAWTLTNGPILDGLDVLHRCDNPPCCNPNHLFLGTQADNNIDRDLKGRQVAPKGDHHPCAKLTSAQVIEIRKLKVEGIAGPQICDMFGITKDHLSQIILRKVWKHL